MIWYEYIECFFAGAFLANAVPHFVQGICGNRFPTPFAKPPGKGLSSPSLNVVWGLLNLVVGYMLFGAGDVWNGGYLARILFFLGVVAMSIMLSVGFQKKHAE
jgi:hypothetical protein